MALCLPCRPNLAVGKVLAGSQIHLNEGVLHGEKEVGG